MKREDVYFQGDSLMPKLHNNLEDLNIEIPILHNSLNWNHQKLSKTVLKIYWDIRRSLNYHLRGESSIFKKLLK